MIDEPALVRLTQWKLLERSEANEADVESHIDKGRRLAGALGVNPGRGMDAFMLALAMAQVWNMTSPAVRQMGNEPDKRLTQHRKALIAAAEAAMAALE